MENLAERPTVVGVFEDPERAEEAVSDLLGAGFRRDQIEIEGPPNGRNLVIVETEDRAQDAADLLRRHGPYNVYSQEPIVGSTPPGARSRDTTSFDEGSTGGASASEADTTSPQEVGIRGQAATGESSPRETFGEAGAPRNVRESAPGNPADLTVTGSGAVREGSSGGSFGEATTGGGTIRAGSTGGGPADLGSEGSTHDVGVRGPGTVGEGRGRLRRWNETTPGESPPPGESEGLGPEGLDA